MHDYYRRNQEKLQKKMNVYLHLIQPEIEEIFNKPYCEVFEEVWECYQSQMLEKLPYIGGDDVSGTGNLIGCMFFIAFGVVAERYGLGIHEWGQLSTIMYQRYFERIPGLLRRLAGKLMRNHPALITKALRRKDAKNEANAKVNPGSFVTQTMDGTDEYPIIYHNLVCPVYEFCKNYGYMAYLPYMCNLDYVMFAALGVALHREKTCATGDGLCDFKMSVVGEVPAVWPPHILDDTDPLK